MAFALLFLCTGNQCRSPFAAELTRHRLAGRDVVVRSAGLMPGGQSVPAEGIRIGSEYRLDLSAHVSRRFDRELADDADLVLTMTNAQAREVVTSHLESWPRVFTLKSFVRWLGTEPVPAGGITRAWLEDVAAARSPHELLGSNAADEVEDPMGRSLRTWRRVAAELADAVNLLVPVLPALPARSRVSAI
jgi:protein-tyrosine phosphatase